MEENLEVDGDEQLKKIAKELTDVQSQLAENQCQLTSAVKRAEKSERLYERALAYNEDLREQVDKLSKQLHVYKTKVRAGIDKSSQTEINKNNLQGALLAKDSNGDLNQDNRKNPPREKADVSLAESLRETAEAAAENSGFVYDENTGLYYDYNSGYFYDNENSLYFDPPSGTYFYYDEEAKDYKFHCQVDMTQYYNDQSKLPSHHHPVTEQSKPQSKKRTDQDDVKLKRQSRKRKKRLKADYDVDPSDESQAHSLQLELNPPLKNAASDVASGRGAASGKQETKSSNLIEEDLISMKIPKQSDNNLKPNTDSEEDSSSSYHSNSESEMESGELTDESSDSDHADVCYEDSNHGDTHGNLGDGVTEEILVNESNPGNYPPCIRVMVTESDVCNTGTLFIVTYTGGTIGREGSHVICLPELAVSKFHAEIRYVDEDKNYVIVDGANQNGTFVNGIRISEPRCAGDPQVLKHGDVIVIGSSHLLCHIHPGLDTCDGCEPGQVIANIQAQNTQPKEIIILSKEEKEKLRRKQLKSIKKKYGLENMNYSETDLVPQNPTYADKSEERRQTVGSDNPYQKTEAPASVHRQISTSNKGHQLLQKMGWTEGGGLGKNNHGIQEPVKVSFRLNKSAGLGSVLEQKTDMENANQSKHSEVWLKTKQRFQAVENLSPHTRSEKTRPAQTQWVTGETIQFGESSDQLTAGSTDQLPTDSSNQHIPAGSNQQATQICLQPKTENSQQQ